MVLQELDPTLHKLFAKLIVLLVHWQSHVPQYVLYHSSLKSLILTD